MSDWVIKNTAMVDHPEAAALWGLAATRVAGKPFTVTEYNHAAPNEYEAECVPMIATYAALQDWDGIFLFAYSHGNDYDKGRTSSFFDVEGNPLKMPFLPLASRLFLGGGTIEPLRAQATFAPTREQMLSTGSRYYYQQWPFIRDVGGLNWQTMTASRVAIKFDGPAERAEQGSSDDRLRWTPPSNGNAHGTFTARDPHAWVSVGSIDGLATPFASAMLVPADPKQTLESADRLLLVVASRAQNTGMQWDAERHSVGNQWGKAPPQVEVVRGEFALPAGRWKAFALKPDGGRGDPAVIHQHGGREVLTLGTAPTIQYELVREP